MSINVQNITPVIGAEVSGIDLTQIDEVTAASLRRLLADRGVLVFRDQQLDHAAHKRAAACFGTANCIITHWQPRRAAPIRPCSPSRRQPIRHMRLGMAGTPMYRAIPLRSAPRCYTCTKCLKAEVVTRYLPA